jgi:RNA polymerase sigma-70 factor (ECF subfamily)
LGPKLQQPGFGPAPARPEAEPAVEVAALTRAMAKGDEMAYAKFYDLYFERLRRYLLVVAAGNEEPAREALQSTLVRVVRHIREFPSDEVFWGWLTVLARSCVVDQSRKRRRYFAFLDRFTRHTEIEHSPGPDSEGRLLALMEEQLVALPPGDRELVEAKYLEGSSVREIAAQLETSEKAVESHLGRIRRKLKQAVLEALKHEE